MTDKTQMPAMFRMLGLDKMFEGINFDEIGKSAGEVAGMINGMAEDIRSIKQSVERIERHLGILAPQAQDIADVIPIERKAV